LDSRLFLERHADTYITAKRYCTIFLDAKYKETQT